MGYESLPKAAEEELYQWYCSSAHAWGVWAWTPATGAARWVVEPGELLYAWHDGVSWGLWASKADAVTWRWVIQP